MKKIEAIISPSKLEQVKNALAKIGIHRMTISKVDEFGSQQSHKEIYRARTYVVDVIKEFKIEMIVATDEMLSKVIDTIKRTIKPEGDEDIFVSPLEDVNQAGTGMHERNTL